MKIKKLEDKKDNRIGFRATNDNLERIYEMFEYKQNQQNGNYKFNDFWNDLVQDEYFRFKGKTNDSDTFGMVNRLTDDAVNAKFGELEDLRFSILQIRKMLDIVLRREYGNQAQRIKKSIDNSGGKMTEQEAINEDNKITNILLTEDSEMLKAITEYFENITDNDDRNGYFE